MKCNIKRKKWVAKWVIRASVWTWWGESCGSGMGVTTRGQRAMQLVLTWWSHATHCSWREGHWWDWQLGDWELCSWYWHGGPMQHTAPHRGDIDAASDNSNLQKLLSDSTKFHVRQNTIQQTHTHTHTPVLRPFFHDYPDKPAPEETYTFTSTVTFRSHPICS